ncbi:hypothetical protein K439DRAFT_560139 [Ramaria rubella]|nr:hypothetical protein K439DRAFT_560139 [Ramaria rubella]
MVLRVYALYGAKRVILLCLLLLLLIETLTMISTMTFLNNYSKPPENAPALCPYNVRFPKTEAIFWASPLLGDTVIFILTVTKTRQYSKGNGPLPMLRLLFRDGTLYYSVVFLLHFINLLLIVQGPTQLRTFAASFTQTFSTILVCRIVLNLRKQASQSFLGHLHSSDNHPSATADTPETTRTGQAVFTSIAAAVLTFFEPSASWLTSESGADAGYNLELENMG